MTDVQPTVLTVAEEVAGELMEAGARAVVLTGSHARGDATPQSDLDLYVIGDGPDYRLERRHEYLVSVSWRIEQHVIQAFESPSDVGGLVPGWRQAVVLVDPSGVAAGLIDRANAWAWDVIGNDRLNEWVAEQLTGYAEEVHKLVSHIERQKLQFAAVERSVLALRIPMIMAVHKRILYDSENDLWDLVADRMGVEWSKNQSAALGLTERPFDEGCDGALALYVTACEEVSDLFDARQKVVVGHACDFARQAG